MNSRLLASRGSVRRPECVASDAILRVFWVPPECAGMRVDVFVQTQLRNTSRTRARAIVENSAFTADARRLRPNHRVQANSLISLWRPQFEAQEPASELAILHQDEHLLAVDKPALMAVHPSARYHTNTILKQLELQRPGEHLALLHRLDRETSGILLFARSPMADRAFKRVIEHRSVYVARSTIDGLNTETLEKTYLAITRGVPEPGIIDLPIEPDLENPLRVKMRLARAGRGLAAKTLIDQVEERVGYALVRCRLLTGRQHQIRLHLSSVGCPVVGDKLYGPDERLLARAADRLLDSEDLRLLELPRHALHAARYRLPHAVTGEALDLVSPLPEDLRSFWDELMRNPPNSPCRQPSANSSLALAPSKE